MHHAKKRRHAMILLTKACCMLAVVALLFSCLSCKKGSDVPLSPGLSTIRGEPVYDSDVAMQTDHFTVTPGMMAFFFYGYGGEIMVEMEKNVAYDGTKSLHDQIYADGLSWYDVLMNSTLQKVSEMLIYCEAAKEAGVTLTDAQRAAVAEDITSLRVDAASLGLELDGYLQRLYGPLMTEADLQVVYEYEALAAVYSATVITELEQGITKAQADAYATANGLTDGTLSRNIAYAAVPYVASKPNETELARISQAMQVSPTSETLQGFASVASVGSVENLTPDNTGVRAIADWLYDGARSVGDWGCVETDAATYILIYTGNGMRFAEVTARMRLYDAAYADWYNGWVERLQFGYNYDILDGYDVA